MSDHTTDMLYARGYDQAQRDEFGSAATLYARNRRDGRRGRFWSTGSRASRHLLNLSEIEGTLHVDARRMSMTGNNDSRGQPTALMTAV